MDGEGEKLAKVVAHTVDRDYMVEDPEFDRIGFTMMLDPISDVSPNFRWSPGKKAYIYLLHRKCCSLVISSMMPADYGRSTGAFGEQKLTKGLSDTFRRFM